MTDRDIIEMLENRNEEALRLLQEKYGPYCYAIAFNVLSDAEDAKEIVNDSFLDLWNSIPPAKPERLHAYLGTIVRHNAINLYHKRQTNKNRVMSSAIPLEEATEKTYTDENAISHLVIGAAMDRFLESLSEKNRQVFVARFYYNSSIEDIARTLDMPAGSVKSIIHRTKKALKEFLDKEGIDV
ncbi:MAG: RNA polymerase sigma factor [Clostridia bacterium]|nr:RNA polymerase sigma factor [Clostridia bacterium]